MVEFQNHSHSTHAPGLASAALDRVFQALGDPTRRAMLARLAEGEHSVGELAAPFRMTLAAASKHIKTLERAGLVRRDVRGRSHVCMLEPAPLADAERWLQMYARFWTERLDALETLLRAEDAAHAAEDHGNASPAPTANDVPHDDTP